MSEQNVDPMKKSSIYAIFGRYYGEKLFRLLYDCCDGFCVAVRKCLGISSDGDSAKVLNQQGDWIPVDGSGIYLPLAGGTMDIGSHIYFGTGGQNLAQGTFDNGTGGNKGISLNCAVGYELNWQGGKLSSSFNNGANFVPIIVNQPDAGGVITEVNTFYDGEATRYHLKKTLSDTDIQNAGTTPIDIGLPTSGLGYYYRVVSVDVKLNYGGVPFISNSLFIGTYSTGVSQKEYSQLQVVNNDFRTTTNSGGLSPNLSENDIISIWADMDSIGSGNSSIDCYITVEKVKL